MTERAIVIVFLMFANSVILVIVSLRSFMRDALVGSKFILALVLMN